MSLLLRDFVTTTLSSAPAGTTGTSLTVQAGDGALFPAVGGGNVMPAVIQAVDGSAREAVMVTGRAGDSFTITRSASPVAWSGNGQVFYLALTAAAFDEVYKASNHSVVPAGGITAANVQAALEELDGEVVAAQAATAALVPQIDDKAPIDSPAFTTEVTLPGNAVDPLNAVPLQQLVAYVEDLCFSVGDYKLSARTSFPAGRRWLLCDGKTIGSATSGATARANADVQELFEFLWTTYDNTICPIQDSTGAASTRGASAAADFAANKRLSLLNWSGLGIRVHHNGDSTYETDMSRVLGSYQADAFQGHRHALNATAGSTSRDGGTFTTASNSPGAVLDPITDGVNGEPRVAAETRMKNRSANMFIRY